MLLFLIPQLVKYINCDVVQLRLHRVLEKNITLVTDLIATPQQAAPTGSK